MISVHLLVSTNKAGGKKMKKLTELIIRWPVKVIMVTLFIVAILAIGVTNITLKTGNDTLISDKTDIYIDNEAYQNEFGRDPIILIFTEDQRFDPETIKLMNRLQTDIKDLNGIFAINSPVTIITEISKKMYIETENGLAQISNGLLEMSNQLKAVGLQLRANDGFDMPDLEGFGANMQSLIQAQENLDTGLVNIFEAINMMKMLSSSLSLDLEILKTNIESDPSLFNELNQINGIISKNNTLLSSLTNLSQSDAIKEIPVQTTEALFDIISMLQGLSTKLDEQVVAMKTLSNSLINVSNNLLSLSINLEQIKNNFNTFKPGFPTSDDTIHMMMYENNELRNNFEGFIVSENQVRMVIVLEGNITDSEIDIISTTLFDRLKLEEIDEGILISGKPILDRSIKSEMMNSMKNMMISAIIVMILILIFTYNVRMRLLPIFMILIVVVVTIGIMGWLNMGLTMVSMAVFPILIGLGIDYFIQFQTRYEEERSKL